jgi:acyl carrier protein
MTSEAIKARLRELCSRRAPDLADEDDIFEVGGVNSLFAIELLTFVEEGFRIRLEDEDLDRKFFRSINAMAALVERKLDAQG